MGYLKSATRPQEARPAKPTLKRRRCQNCNTLYQPTRADQKFCRTLPDRDKCRKEFYRYGSSYGPLKMGLHKAIDKKYGELFRQMTQRFIDERKRIGMGFADLEAQIEALKVNAHRTMRALVRLKRDYERHTHQFYTDGSGGDIETLGPTEVRERDSGKWREERARLSSASKTDARSR